MRSATSATVGRRPLSTVSSWRGEQVAAFELHPIEIGQGRPAPAPTHRAPRQSRRRSPLGRSRSGRHRCGAGRPDRGRGRRPGPSRGRRRRGRASRRCRGGHGTGARRARPVRAVRHRSPARSGISGSPSAVATTGPLRRSWAVRASMAKGGRATVRTPRALLVGPRPPRERERAIETVPASRSTSDHSRASSSPTRAPVPRASVTSRPASASSRPGSSRRAPRRPSARVGGWCPRPSAHGQGGPRCGELGRPARRRPGTRPARAGSGPRWRAVGRARRVRRSSVPRRRAGGRPAATSRAPG